MFNRNKHRRLFVYSSHPLWLYWYWSWVK